MKRRRWPRILAALAVSLFLFEPLLAVVLVLNHRRGESPPPRALIEAALAVGAVERFEIPSGDLPLAAEWLGRGPSRPVCVFGHGYRHTRRQGDPLALDLLQRGWSVLLFDFRGSGASGGLITTAGAKEAEDVRAVIEYLTRTRGVERGRIAYVGFSMGASAALLAGDALDGLAAVVLIAPYADLLATFEARTLRFAGLPLRPWFSPTLWLWSRITGVDPAAVRPIDHVDRIDAPMLFVGASADWRAPPADLREMAARTGGRAEVVILPGGGHLWLARLDRPVRRVVLRFLDEHRQPPPPSGGERGS